VVAGLLSIRSKLKSEWLRRAAKDGLFFAAGRIFAGLSDSTDFSGLTRTPLRGSVYLPTESGPSEVVHDEGPNCGNDSDRWARAFCPKSHAAIL
jgi:hypothetical protein